jgi:ParB/RepB/Spo0J family partition protein
MIQAGEVKRADAMKVPLDAIHEEPGFNAREQTPEFWQGIREFAQYIASGGTYPALEVRPNPAGGVLVVEGHRRRLALRVARDEFGAPIDLVNIVAFTGNDADRVARIATSQGQVPLTPIELASVYKRLAAFGKTPDEIAAMVSKTRQHVDQLLILANAPTAVQNMVKDGSVSGATAVKVVREHGDDAGQVLQEELGKAKAAGKGKVTEGTIKGKGLPARITTELVDSAEYFLGELKPATLETLLGIEAGRVDDKATVEVSAKALLDVVKTWELVKDHREKSAKRAAERQAQQQQGELAGA